MVKELLSKTEYILKEVKTQFSNVGVLWSGGKDSTALVYMIHNALREIPLRFVHLDNGMEFPETYEHMKNVQENLGFDVIREPIEIKHDDITGLSCCGQNKTEALKRVIKRERFDAIIVSIRWDEHGIRGMERYFSPRDSEFKWNVYNPEKGEHGEAMQDPEFINWGIAVSDFGEDCNHVRVHPILHWREIDVWNYIRKKNISMNELYFSKNGKRFRSIGCKECSVPVNSDAKTIDEIISELEATNSAERAGRMQDKELAMQRLRALGYM